MEIRPEWRELGWQHPVWELLRLYRALRSRADEWIESLAKTGSVSVDENSQLPVNPDDIAALADYIEHCTIDFDVAFDALRTEEEATAYCESMGVTVGKTTTKSSDHHQSSKAMIGSVTVVASSACEEHGIGLDPDPQRRAIWCSENGLHVTARNLDGAIPSLTNPFMIWEIKEYWGKTKGGSKMSDAVYECQLVGRELRDFEVRSGVSVEHVVFLDGKDQWGARKSDMKRFIDLFHQGLIDHLIIGNQVEDEWGAVLESALQGK